MMRRNGFAFSFLVALLTAPPSHAYIRTMVAYSDGTTAPAKRVDNAGIQFYVNSRIGPGLMLGNDPVPAIQAALATWNSVASITSANLKFLPLGVTDKTSDPGDKQMTVVIASTPGDLSVVGGALAVTAIILAAAAAGQDDSKGVITDSDIIINPAYSFSTDRSTPYDLQAVVTHEFGHALGMNHSGLAGAVMFQSTAFSARYLSPDEVAFATAVYPGKGAALGGMNGKVEADDGSPVQSALVTLLDTATGTALSALTGADGAYALQALPGKYIVYAEPMGPGSMVQPANLYLSSDTKVTTNFQVTMLGGFSAPTRIAVTAGNMASAPPLTVSNGTSSLTWPYIGVGTAGGSGDFTVVSGALQVSSGQAVDLQLIGGGVDGSIGVQAFGRGLTVRPGTVRVDPKVSFVGPPLAGQPVVRMTVDLAPVDTPSLVTLILTKGKSVFAVSGAFVLVPPKPAFVTAGVDGATGAQYLGAVSPGGISSIYDVAGAPNLGPANPAANSGYDGYGKLATSLAGVTVTFDGVPAPLFFVYGGQINLQVPFEVAGKTSTRVVVNYLGSVSTAVTVPVVPAQPAFFTATPGGRDAITQNFPDFSLNSASNAIARGGTVLMFGTGIGKLEYPLPTGQPGTVPPGSYSSTYSCLIGGKVLNAYAYWYYGYVGLADWTATVPADTPTGAVTVNCTDSVTGASTPAATIYVK